MTKPDDKNSKIFVNPFEAYSDQAPQYSGFSSYSCYVPMPDGVRLAVDVYLPRNLPPVHVSRQFFPRPVTGGKWSFDFPLISFTRVLSRSTQS